MNKEMAVQMIDLQFLSIKCGDCSTVVTLDLLGSNLEVKHCPACHREYGENVIGNVLMLSQVYRMCKGAKHEMSFRVETL